MSSSSDSISASKDFVVQIDSLVDLFICILGKRFLFHRSDSHKPQLDGSYLDVVL